MSRVVKLRYQAKEVVLLHYQQPMGLSFLQVFHGIRKYLIAYKQFIPPRF